MGMVKLRQLETGAWLQVGKNDQGERQVADIFGRPVICCGECGMSREEWDVEVMLHGCADEPCCEG